MAKKAKSEVETTTETKKHMVVKSVEYGFVPYGPGCGTHGIGVFFGEEDGDYTYPEPTEKKKDNSAWTPDEIAATGLLKDVLQIFKDKDLGDEWSKFLVCRNYGYFVGDCLSAPEHRAVSAIFFDILDSSSLAVQIRIIKDKVGASDKEKLNSEYMKQLNSPLTNLVTSPVHFTGKDDFYQRFRFITCKYPLDAEYLKENFNKMQMAIVEISNHTFASGILDFDGDVEQQMAAFKDTYKNGDILTLPEDRIFVIDHTGDNTVLDFANTHGYRLNKALDYKGENKVLKF